MNSHEASPVSNLKTRSTNVKVSMIFRFALVYKDSWIYCQGGKTTIKSRNLDDDTIGLGVANYFEDILGTGLLKCLSILALVNS